jgi:hypothetical protein
MSEAPDGGMRTATDPTDQPLTEQYSKGWRRAPRPAYLLCGVTLALVTSSTLSAIANAISSAKTHQYADFDRRRDGDPDLVAAAVTLAE